MPDGFRIASAYVEVELDQAPLDAGLAEVRSKLAAIRDRTVRLGIDQAAFDAAIADMKAKLTAFAKDSFKVTFDVDQASMAAVIAEVKAAFATQSAAIPVKLAFDPASAAAAAAAMKGVASATAAANSQASNGMRLWFGWGRISLTAIHWIVSGLIELSAVLIPAAAAAAGWAAVWLQGTTNVVEHMQAVYTATESMANMGAETAGQMVGLGHALQTAQDAANPDVYQALGGAIKIVRENAGGLTQAGLEMGRIFDTFVAKLVYDFSAAGGATQTLGALFHDMVPDLTEFGQIFGNLGHAIAIAAASMPGLAELLLKLLDYFSQGVLDITKFLSSIGTLGFNLITAGMAVEEFMRWGGLLVTVLGKMGVAVEDLGPKFLSVQRFQAVFMSLFTALPNILSSVTMGVAGLIEKMGFLGGAGASASEGLASFAAKIDGVVGGLGFWQAAAITLAGVGLAILIDKIITAKSETQQWTDALQEMADKATNEAVLGTIAENMGRIAEAERQTAQQANSAAGAITNVGQSIHTGIPPVDQLRQKLGQLADGYQQQVQDMKNVTSGAQFLADKYGISVPQAMALADVAGVKLVNGITGQSEAATIARNKIADLVQGYQSMGAPMGTIGNDMLAVAIQTGEQATQVQKLIEAWTQFMQNLTGGTTGLADFETGLQNMTSGIASVKDNLSKGSGLSATVSQFAELMKHSTGDSAQAWQNFNQVVGNTAPQLVNWLQTAGSEGVISGKQFSTAVASMIEQLLPFAKDSSTATSELSGLAQMAGGPATTSYQTLKNWTDKTGGSTKDLQKIIDTVTQKMSNMSQVAQNLGNVMGNDLANMMDQARLKVSGVQGAVDKYTQSLENNTQNTAGGKQARQQLITDLEKAGLNATQAKQYVDALTNSIHGNGSTSSAEHQYRQQLIDDLTKSGQSANTAKTDVDDYTKAVQNNGSQSDAAKSARKQLITDLENSGLSAQAAQKLVDALTKSITKIPKNANTNITVNGKGEWSVFGTNSSESAGNPLLSGSKKAARGLMVHGGIPGVDSVPILAQEGEAVVPRHLVPSIAPLLKAHGVPGFASGGVVGSYSGTPAGTGVWADKEDTATQNAIIKAVEEAMQKAINQDVAAAKAAAAAAAGGTGGPAGHMSATETQIANWWTGAGGPGGMTSHIAAAITGAESGFRVNAVQQGQPYATTGWGLWQITPGDSEPQAGINQALLTGPTNARAAVAKYRQAGGSFSPWTTYEDGAYKAYMDQGGWLPPGKTLVTNNTGQPERVVPPGGSSGSVNVNFYGTQYPNPEQIAALKMELGAAVSLA